MAYDDKLIEAIAKVAHEANRSWCTQDGDYSQANWLAAPDWQRESIVLGVKFHLDHPHAQDSASHDEWMKVKIADGWVYGRDKNPRTKTHPCIVPFHSLSNHHQTKDRLFRAIVHALKGDPT